MKSINYIILLAFLGLMIQSSCKALKKQPNKSNGNDDNSSALIDKYIANKLDFDQLEFSAKMDYAGDGMSIGFDGIFRIKNNELIWGSLKKFGLEVARLQITPDSIKVLNRFQKMYMSGAIEDLKSKSGVPLQFDDIQQLLLGGSFWTNNLVQLNDTTLTQTEVIKGDLVEGIHIFDTEGHIESSKVQSQKQGNVLVKYDDHRVVKDVILAFDRQIQAERKGTNVLLTLKTQKFELDSTKSFPFEIPNNYKHQSM